MRFCVFGAPGSGKTEAARVVAKLLPDFVVLDWDVFMAPASELAGRSIPTSPSTWSAYSRLVRSALDAAGAVPTVLFGPCTPDELHDWHMDVFVLLDCSDDVRASRLMRRGHPEVVDEAAADAREYRALAVPIIDTSDLTVPEVGERIAQLVRSQLSPT